MRRAAAAGRPAAALRPRVNLLDTLRGFSLVSMILYHGMYDLVYLFGVQAPWYTGRAGYIWQQSICWVFILVSGASLHYGRRPARRGLLVLGCAMVLTLVTAVAMPGQVIRFGVLHFLGVAMLLGAALRGPLARVPAWAGLVVCAALFVFSRYVPYGSVGVLDVPLLALPAWLYASPWWFWLGFPGAGFQSADYFSVIPWIFLYFTGWFIWALVKMRVPAKAPARNPLAALGRHSLLVYMLHQPLLYGLCWALAALGVL